MNKQTNVDDLWPGDVVYYLGDEHRVARVENDEGQARVVFTTSSGKAEYDANFLWNSQFLVVG